MVYSEIDYETTGFNAYKGDKIFAYVTTEVNNKKKLESIVDRFDHIDDKKNKESMEYYHDYWANTGVSKVAHNLKFELGFTVMSGVEIPKETELHDTLILAQLLNNLMPSYKLEKLCNTIFGIEECQEYNHWDKEVKKHLTKQTKVFKNWPTRKVGQLIKDMNNDGVDPLVKNRKNYGLIPRDIMDNYQVSDGERGLLLFQPLWEEIQKDKALLKLYNIEIELIKASQKMEQTGIMIDIHQCNDLTEWLTEELKNPLKVLKEELPKTPNGDYVNIDSSQQLSYALYNQLDFPVIERSKKTGKPSTSTACIEALQKIDASPIFDSILKYRAYNRGIKNIKLYVELAGDNRVIHPRINTNIAKTGRQSISDPALQVVSKATASGVKYPIPARKCFRTTPGHILLAPDYSGIELWLIIDTAQELELIDILNKDPEFNVHSYCCDTFTGSKKWRDRPGDEPYLIRAGMKNYDFGKPYGGKFEIVTNDLKNFYSLQERREGDKRFSKHFPGIYNFSKNMSHYAKENGFIETAFGRKLYIDEGKEYTSANYIIQGTAAQILKIAQVNLSKYFQRAWNDEVKLIFPVHDELVMRCPRKIWCNDGDRKKLFDMVNYHMVNMPQIKINLKTEWKIIRTNWANGEEYNG